MWLVLVLRFIILYKHAELRKHLSSSCLMALSNSLGYLRCLEPLHVHAIITLTESFHDVEQLQPYHRIERIYMCILSRPRSLPEVFCLLVHGKLIRLNAIKSPSVLNLWVWAEQRESLGWITRILQLKIHIHKVTFSMSKLNLKMMFIILKTYTVQLSS